MLFFQSVLWEFQFGAQYAWMLCVFTVTMTYSVVCPLITPFGKFSEKNNSNQYENKRMKLVQIMSLENKSGVSSKLLNFSGLVYLLMKHLVDRYNIYFAYGPSRIDKDIHASAINFVIVGVILLQCAVCFFDILRAGT